MKLGIVFNNNKWNAILTKFFTGCYAYHTFWVDEENSYVYDMSFLRRRRIWPKYEESEVLLYDFPEVSKEYLEKQLTVDNSKYGYVDYVLFSIRWLYHLVGKPARNSKGIICSEMNNIDLRACGVSTPWELTDAPPSPCELFNWAKNRE